MRRPMIILGSSGLAREMAMLAEQINARWHRWKILGFIGASASEVGNDLGLAPVLGDDAWLLAQEIEADLVVGIGYPSVKARVVQKYLGQASRFEFPNLVHPLSSLDFRRIEMGRGNIVTAGCQFTCDIEVGDFNLFNLNVTVGHDARIGDFNVFNPGVNVSGSVVVGDRVLVGTGCQILERLEVGDGATLGAGAVVTKPVQPGMTVVGVPARPLAGK